MPRSKRGGTARNSVLPRSQSAEGFEGHGPRGSGKGGAFLLQVGKAPVEVAKVPQLKWAKSAIEGVRTRPVHLASRFGPPFAACRISRLASKPALVPSTLILKRK